MTTDRREILHDGNSQVMITDNEPSANGPLQPWGKAMEILSHGARIDGDHLQRHQVEAELARLRAQVAWLQAERAALWWAVGHDELTGLANRRLFQTLAPALLGDHPGEAVVVVLDLNGFKPVNDRLGHHAGDLVLRLLAERLTRVRDDLVARFGREEF